MAPNTVCYIYSNIIFSGFKTERLVNLCKIVFSIINCVTTSE